MYCILLCDYLINFFVFLNNISLSVIVTFSSISSSDSVSHSTVYCVLYCYEGPIIVQPLPLRLCLPLKLRKLNPAFIVYPVTTFSFRRKHADALMRHQRPAATVTVTAVTATVAVTVTAVTATVTVTVTATAMVRATPLARAAVTR